MTVKFLTIGHLTHDLTPDGFRLGGTVSFSAVTARRLGWTAGVLTRGTLDGLSPKSWADGPGNATGLPGTALEGVEIHLLPSPVTTTFTNIYRDGQRTQVVTAIADPITPEQLPQAWAQAPVVLLGPLVREVPAAWMDAFPGALIAITPQGWMRAWDDRGHVRPTRWEAAAEFLARADAVILSREDVGGDEAYLAELAQQARLLVVTDGWHGATVYQHDSRMRIPPRPTTEVEPTGAGDVFAAAFIIRLAETGDPFIAARFANVVASMSIEAVGMDAIPYRAQVDAWLHKNS